MENENKVLPSHLKPRSQHEIVEGDILITRAGPRVRVGVCCLVRKVRAKLINCDKVYRVRVNKTKILPEYFEFILNSPVYLRLLEEMKTGISDSGVNLTQKKFLSMRIPVPPLSEQARVIEEIDNKLTNCDAVSRIVDQSLQSCEGIKQSLLQKAFEGKLVVQDTKDEPAMMLLTKIKQEREELLKNTKRNGSAIIPLRQTDFPKTVPGIAATDLHVGIVAMVIEAHQINEKHAGKLSHVKCEKISDLVERKIGISLGRVAMKDAAGPDDYPHLKKVEHRAKMTGAFACESLGIGHTYKPMRNLHKAVENIKTHLLAGELQNIEQLIKDFLPFELEHAELIATLFAGWNNLLIYGKQPTDEEIVYESRENWSSRKLTIEREKFFKALKWMKEHYYIPEGRGALVLKKEETTGKKKGKSKANK